MSRNKMPKTEKALLAMCRRYGGRGRVRYHVLRDLAAKVTGDAHGGYYVWHGCNRGLLHKVGRGVFVVGWRV